jgi:hypothetical protein
MSDSCAITLRDQEQDREPDDVCESVTARNINKTHTLIAQQPSNPQTHKQLPPRNGHIALKIEVTDTKTPLVLVAA